MRKEIIYTCDYCSTTNSRVFKSKKFNKYVCDKHYGQLCRLGKTLENVQLPKYLAFGQEKRACEWAKDDRCKVTYKVLHQRIKSGWEIEEAISIPPKYEIEINQRFNRLIVESGEIKKGNHIYYLCICDCGNRKTVRKDSLIEGRVSSCGCKDKERIERLRTNPTQLLPNGLGAKRMLFSRYKATAKRKNRAWDLSEEFVYELVTKNCFYCDIPPNCVKKSSKFAPEFIHHGIDRIDSNKGYIKDNVVSCCFPCNWMKRNLTTDQFYSFVEKLYKSLKSKGLIKCQEK